MSLVAMRNFIYGFDLNNGRGFESFKEALSTIDYDNIPYWSLWKINSEVYRLVKVLGKPVFDFYEEK